MTEWGKRKDGQSYPKDGKKGVHSSNTAPVSDVQYKGKEPTSGSIELLADMGDESYYKVIGIESTPSIDDKEIKSDLYIRVINMKEATGDAQFDDEPYFAELLLLPKLNEISNNVWKSIAESNSMSIAEIKKSKYAPVDVMSYGYSIRLQEESGSDPEKLINELAKNAPAHAFMIGFDLDRPWNQIGNTGWDTLKEITTGKKLSMEELFQRNKQ